MSGRLLTKRKLANTITTDYTIPAGKIFAGELQVRGSWTGANVGVALKAADITDTDTTMYYTTLPASTYTAPSQASLEADYRAAGGDLLNTLSFKDITYCAANTTPFIIADGGRGVSVDGGVTWVAPPYVNGRWISGHQNNGSGADSLWCWDGNITIYIVTDISALTIGSSGIQVSDLATYTPDPSYLISIAWGSGTSIAPSYVSVFYGNGRRAATTSTINNLISATLYDTSIDGYTSVKEYGLGYSSSDNYRVFLNTGTQIGVSQYTTISDTDPDIAIIIGGAKYLGMLYFNNINYLTYIPMSPNGYWYYASTSGPFGASYSTPVWTPVNTGIDEPLQVVYKDTNTDYFVVITASGKKYINNSTTVPSGPYTLVYDTRATSVLDSSHGFSLENIGSYPGPDTLAPGNLAEKTLAPYADAIRFNSDQLPIFTNVTLPYENTPVPYASYNALYIGDTLYNTADFATTITGYGDLVPPAFVPFGSVYTLTGLMLSAGDEIVVSSDSDIEINLFGLLQ